MAIVNEICGIPFISMPCTRKQFVMYVCFSEHIPLLKNSLLLPIKMFEADPKDSNQMKQFIKVLMFAINAISMYYSVKFKVEPQRGLILTTPFYMVLKEFISQIKQSTNFTTEMNLKIKRHSDWI